MKSFFLQTKLERLSFWLQTLGAGGLFMLTLLDSAAIPTAGAPDALLLVLATQGQAFFAALVATLGSTAGCVILYLMSRAAGAAALNRFSEVRRERTLRWLARYDLLAVLVAVILPPPFPLKVFVVSAGVLRLHLSRFIAAVLVGRALRYGLLAWLAYRYGNEAKEVFARHYRQIGLSLALALITGWLIYRLIKRRRAARVSSS
jgi:membrane protein YqaA with SNARE-associated domain